MLRREYYKLKQKAEAFVGPLRVRTALKDFRRHWPICNWTYLHLEIGYSGIVYFSKRGEMTIKVMFQIPDADWYAEPAIFNRKALWIVAQSADSISQIKSKN